jgi:hypothetical protein
MIEGKEHVFSDEAVRQFLLGSLSPTDQSLLEHSLFVDESLEERVRLAELELSDDYTADRLNRADRELFKQRFLLTTNREQTLAVSRALHDNFAVTGSTTRTTFWQNTVGLFDIRRHSWKYALATVTLMLLLLGTALLIKREKLHRANVTPPRVSPRPTATAVQQRANHPMNSSAPTHNETSPTLPLHEGLATSIVLESATPPESAPMISTSGDVLTVQLTLDQPNAESYDVSVTTVAGEPVFSADGVPRTEEKMLGVDVPTGSIKRGDFKVTLTRVDGEAKQIAGTYYFRVRLR